MMSLPDPGSLSIADIRHWGLTMVFSPHPDDESLGCGGAIAMLRKHGTPVHVVLMTDGSKSHNSPSVDAVRLARIRLQELYTATSILGLSRHAITTLGYADGELPQNDADGNADFAQAVARVRDLLMTMQPATALIPHHADEHRDHRATAKILSCAARLLPFDLNILAYPIWTADSVLEEKFERSEVTAVDIESVRSTKRRAIQAHRSQTGELFIDDPLAFRLQPDKIDWHCQQFEIYLTDVSV